MEEVNNSEESVVRNSDTIPEEGIYQLFVNPAKFQPKGAKKLNRTPKRKQPEDSGTENESERPRTPSGQVLSNTGLTN